MSRRSIMPVTLVLALLLAGLAISTFPGRPAHAQDRLDGAAARTPAISYAPSVFPATENPEVARAYATAYIVGEALKVRAMDAAEISELTMRVNRSLR